MAHHSVIAQLKNWMSQQIIGQEKLVDRLLIALLAGGHLLVEGAPGLAKTKAIKNLSEGVEGDFHRIQFTPDLLPSDITGTEIYRPEDGSFRFQQGPIFHNLVLADEINRAPAKVQSALLEAMAEHQVSVGRQAQLDRFLMHVTVDYPTLESERKILHLVRNEARNLETTPPARVSQQTLFAARQEVLNIHMSEAVEEYILQLIMATRNPARYSKELANWIDYGASPRGTISLDLCARAHAWLKGKDFVSPEDVHEVFYDVLRHRVLLSFEAEAAGVDADKVLNTILELVPTA
jgi:MoxR-like ATPase